MNESKVERELVKQVKAHGGLCIKLVPMFFAGLPDRLVLMPDSQMCFVETKAPGLTARKLQLVVHKMIRNLGFKVYIVDNYATISLIIAELTQSKAR